MRRWWTAKRGEMTVCEIDLRVGGANTAVPGERIVSTEVYEGIPDADSHASLNTLTFAEHDGRTTVTILVEHATKEGRDMHIQSGMEDGLQDALDLLEEIALSLR